MNFNYPTETICSHLKRRKTTHNPNLSLPRCGQGLSLEPAMNPRMSAFSGRVTRFAVRNISCASTICSLVSVSARRCGCPPACGRCCGGCCGWAGCCCGVCFCCWVCIEAGGWGVSVERTDWKGGMRFSRNKFILCGDFHIVGNLQIFRPKSLD